MTAAPPAAPAVPDTVAGRALLLPSELPAVALDHPYFEAAWLPTVGPTSWLVWRTLARTLANDPHSTWPTAVLARRHGVGSHVLVRSLGRLVAFSVARQDPDGTYAIPTACPGLWPTLLRRASPATRRLHRQTFALHG